MKTKLSFSTVISFFTLNEYSQCPDDNVFCRDISRVQPMKAKQKFLK